MKSKSLPTFYNDEPQKIAYLHRVSVQSLFKIVNFFTIFFQLYILIIKPVSIHFEAYSNWTGAIKHNMTNEQIEKFVSQHNNLDKAPVTISFKARTSITGLFIKTADYSELRAKNLWRIVNGASIEEYQKSKDLNLARIFNGVEFTRLNVIHS